MFVESLHHDLDLEKGEHFLEFGKRCTKIGYVQKGVLRGYVIDNDGKEITTHFYQEGDIILGSYVPNVNATIYIQALTPCEISTANYAEIMSYVNVNNEITRIVNHAFLKLNTQLQSRLVALLNLNALEKYTLFLKEYKGLINRIPHYYVANFLGITPTQLSRARKSFSQQL